MVYQSHQSRSDIIIFYELLSDLVSPLYDPFYKAKYRNIVPGTGIKTGEDLLYSHEQYYFLPYCDQELLLIVRYFSQRSSSK